jgi:hypothetical protein
VSPLSWLRRVSDRCRLRCHWLPHQRASFIRDTTPLLVAREAASQQGLAACAEQSSTNDAVDVALSAR